MVAGKIRVLDLFSGIGGFSLGLERAGMETVAFCEIEDYPRKVLAKHWPNVPIYDDVRTLNATRLAADGIERIDLICGGFPCQDISNAGRKDGIEGVKSGLWAEYSRLIRELQPEFAIMENVAALLYRGLSRVLGGLAEIGYDAEWHCLPASNLGAPHERDRIWIIAYPHGTQFKGRGLSGRIYKEYTNIGGRSWWENKPGIQRVANGIPAQMDRLKCLGNAVVPQIPEIIGRAIIQCSQEK